MMDNHDHCQFVTGIIWQLMRGYTLYMLQQLSKSDKPIEEAAIILWANETVSCTNDIIINPSVGRGL